MKITTATKQKWAKVASSTKFEGYDEPFKDLNKILEATGAYCMFKFKDGKRGKDTLIGGTKFLALDIDDSTITDKECHFLLGDINHHIARTSDPDNAFKFRLLVELDALVDISDAQWKIFLQLVGEELGLSLDLLPKSQLFFAYGAEEVLSVTDEEPLQTRELIMKSAEYITNKPTKPKLSKQAKLDALSDRRETFSYAYEALNGKGSKFLVRAGLQALELGASIEEVEELIYDINDYWTVSMDNDRIENTVLSYLRRKAL